MSPDLLPGNGQGGSRWRRRRHVDALGTAGYRAAGYYESNPALRQALDAVASGAFSNGDRAAFAALVDSLLYDDQYRVLADYQSYIDAQDRVEHAYRDPRAWTRSAVLNVARSGFFSSDRAIRDYNDRIWHTPAVSRRLTQFDPDLP
jgi:starch phosphorylase